MPIRSLIKPQAAIDKARSVWRAFLVLPPKKRVTYSVLATGVVTVVLLSAVFLFPRNTTLHYSGDTCIRDFVLLPTIFQSDGSETEVRIGSSIGIGDITLAATSLCMVPISAPMANSSMDGRISLRSASFINKRITLDVPDYPVPNGLLIAEVDEVAVRDTLEFEFSEKDTIFTYAVTGNNKKHECDKRNIMLACDLSNLELEQAADYELAVARTFDGETIEKVDEGTVTTSDPLEVIDSSIDQDELVYERPQEIQMSFNKSVAVLDDSSISAEVVAGDGEHIDFTVEADDTRAIITFADDLPRDETIQITLDDVQASDNSMLAEPWILTFDTSGGPEVSSTNTPRISVPLNHQFRITFDQELDEQQEIYELIRVSGDSGVVDHTASIDGDQVLISPEGDLPLCENTTIEITGELASRYDVVADIDWQQTAKTTCKRTSIIGYSVQDRPIYAHTFGDGPSTHVYVGGMHGNEYSSVVVLDAWIDELEERGNEIPDHRSIVIIPESSPDSVVARNRLNSRDVDLNRNFPTDDWQSEVYIPGPTRLEEGGGPEPLSEPESRALANFIRQQRPDLVLTYHAVASIVISNDAGNSITVGREYAERSGYGFSTTADIEEVFDYPATGAFEDWIHDELNRPALLIELATMAGNELHLNRDALWYTVRLP